MDIDGVTKGIGAITATFALVGGGYTLSDKLGVFDKDILTWAPEHFKISDGPATGEFKVSVAREKHRGDCTVSDFILDECGIDDWAGYAYDEETDRHYLRPNEFIGILVKGYQILKSKSA